MVIRAGRHMKVSARSAIREDNKEYYDCVLTLPAIAVRVPGGKSIGHFLPVDHVEPVVDICGAQIIMFEIIGVLPDVDIQEKCAGLAQRCILIGGGHDLEDTIVGHKPCVAGSEDRQRGRFEL